MVALNRIGAITDVVVGAAKPPDPDRGIQGLGVVILWLPRAEILDSDHSRGAAATKFPSVGGITKPE